MGQRERIKCDWRPVMARMRENSPQPAGDYSRRHKAGERELESNLPRALPRCCHKKRPGTAATVTV